MVTILTFLTTRRKRGRMNSVLERSDGNLPVILCPKTGIKRPVAACICLCEKKDVNFCQQIKKVAIEELDLVAEDLPETNQQTWQSRRDFFLTTALGERSQHDKYDESVNGGGGLQSAEDLGINFGSATSEEETDIIPSDNEADPLSDGDDSEPVVTDGDFPAEPYTGDDEGGDAELDGDQDGDDGDKTASVDDDDDSMASLAHEAAANAESSDDPSDPEGDGSDMAKKKCPHCEEKFDTDRGRNIHIGRKHSDEEQTPAASKKKTSKKKSAASSSRKPPSGKKGSGMWIIAGDDNQYRVATEQDEIAGLAKELQDEQDESGEVHIYEIAREVKIKTEVTIVDI